MSLITILISNEGKKIRECIGNIKPHLILNSPEGVSWGSEPHVKAYRNENWYAGLVGMAWDYWIRLWLLQRHKGSEGSLVAEGALSKFPVRYDTSNMLVMDFLRRRGINVICEEEKLSEAEEIRHQFDNVKTRRKAAICGDIDICSDRIMEDVVFLASLEQSCRSGYSWKKPIDEIVRIAINELHQLTEVWLLDHERFGPSCQQIWPNPTFGIASAFVGGADADVIIGNTLWDFKTTKHLRYQSIDWAQLLGYFVLNELNNSPIDIQRIGLYFARFGTVAHIDMSALKEIIDLKEFSGMLLQVANHQAAKVKSFSQGGLLYKKITDFKLKFIEDEILANTEFFNSSSHKSRVFVVTNILKNHFLTNELEFTIKELDEYTKKLWKVARIQRS